MKKMKKQGKSAKPGKAGAMNRDLTTLMSTTGSSLQTAEKLLKAVYGKLQDAFLLHYCLHGHLPDSIRSESPIDVRPGFRLHVAAPASTQVRLSSSSSLSPRDITAWQEIPYSHVCELTEAERRNGNLRANEREKCVICMCEFEPQEEGQIVQLGKCKEHFFHTECITAAVGAAECLKCPVCGITYGELTGTMPSGDMTIELDPELRCSGFRKGTWIISYNFRDGVQDAVHYTGNSRQAVLPDTEEGREVLRLLIAAFFRRHTFKIGTSLTNGTTDTVVWSGIHHKSSVDGGPTNFGFPDPSYFQRVKEELAARGVEYVR